MFYRCDILIVGKVQRVSFYQVPEIGDGLFIFSCFPVTRSPSLIQICVGITFLYELIVYFDGLLIVSLVAGDNSFQFLIFVIPVFWGLTENGLERNYQKTYDQHHAYAPKWSLMHVAVFQVMFGCLSKVIKKSDNRNVNPN
jgi:hypothetical protein